MKVVNLRNENYTVYIGRGSKFGNPFKIGRDGNRQEVIDKYIVWVLNHPSNSELHKAIYNLPKDVILGCYCKPLACHGDIIIKIWKELHNELE